MQKGNSIPSLLDNMKTELEGLKQGVMPRDDFAAAQYKAFNQGIERALGIVRSYENDFQEIHEALATGRAI
jgi:hypothetical protein